MDQMGRREHGQDYSKDGNGHHPDSPATDLPLPLGSFAAWPIFVTEMKSLSKRKPVEPPRFWPELLVLASSPRARRTQSSASAPKWSTCTLDYDAQTPANLRYRYHGPSLGTLANTAGTLRDPVVSKCFKVYSIQNTDTYTLHTMYGITWYNNNFYKHVTMSTNKLVACRSPSP